MTLAGIIPGRGGAEKIEALDVVVAADVGDLFGLFGDQGDQGHDVGLRGEGPRFSVANGVVRGFLLSGGPSPPAYAGAGSSSFPEATCAQIIDRRDSIGFDAC